jgi:N utilization substance protein A
LDMKAEGIMPRNQQIGGERFRLHDRVRALLLEVKSTPRGPQLVLSRAHRNFLRRLLENEVPEIYHGMVEIRSIAREPGQRSKVAVSALQPGVDPVGACVGIRGVRIQAIVRELNDEKIDVIEWNPDPAAYIAKALSPARVNGVYLNEPIRGTKTATVVVPEDQLSLAIGRDGQNARLAAKLTSWRIDIKSLPEAASDALHKLQSDAALISLAEQEADTLSLIETILTKKSEGRPITPEEYSTLSQFVDRVERSLISQRQAERKAEKNRRDKILAAIHEGAFEMPIDDLNLQDRVTSMLIDAGYVTIGDLMVQMKMDSDAILGLNGIGPKIMEDINTALSEVTFEKEAVVEEPEIESEVEAVQPEEVLEPMELAEPEVILDQEVEPETSAIAQEKVEEELAVVEIEPETAPVMEEQASELAETVPEIESVEAPPAAEAVESEEEEAIPSFGELLALKADEIELSDLEEEDEEYEEEDLTGKKKKKSKKKKYVEMEYDPDKDVVIVKRKRKRSGDEWNDHWDY